MTKTIILTMQKETGYDIVLKLEKRAAASILPLRSVTGNDTSIFK
jgi:hypothetical protein